MTIDNDSSEQRLTTNIYCLPSPQYIYKPFLCVFLIKPNSMWRTKNIITNNQPPANTLSHSWLRPNGLITPFFHCIYYIILNIYNSFITRLPPIINIFPFNESFLILNPEFLTIRSPVGENFFEVDIVIWYTCWWIYCTIDNRIWSSLANEEKLESTNRYNLMSLFFLLFSSKKLKAQDFFVILVANLCGHHTSANLYGQSIVFMC